MPKLLPLPSVAELDAAFDEPAFGEWLKGRERSGGQFMPFIGASLRADLRLADGLTADVLEEALAGPSKGPAPLRRDVAIYHIALTLVADWVRSRSERWPEDGRTMDVFESTNYAIRRFRAWQGQTRSRRKP